MVDLPVWSPCISHKHTIQSSGATGGKMRSSVDNWAAPSASLWLLGNSNNKNCSSKHWGRSPCSSSHWNERAVERNPFDIALPQPIFWEKNTSTFSGEAPVASYQRERQSNQLIVSPVMVRGGWRTWPVSSSPWKRERRLSVIEEPKKSQRYVAASLSLPAFSAHK